jgi:hypothetical protein
VTALRLVGVPAHPTRRTPPPAVDGALALALPFEDEPGLLSPELVDPAVARRRTPAPELPDPAPWAGRIAQAVVEVVGGVRPAQQLLRWTDPSVYRWLQASAGAPRVRPQAPTRVRSVRTCLVDEAVVEAVAVVDDGRRCRALALRFEGLDGRWVCTVLRVV